MHGRDSTPKSCVLEDTNIAKGSEAYQFFVLHPGVLYFAGRVTCEFPRWQSILEFRSPSIFDCIEPKKAPNGDVLLRIQIRAIDTMENNRCCTMLDNDS